MTQIAAGETQLALELEAFALKKKKKNIHRNQQDDEAH